MTRNAHSEWHADGTRAPSPRKRGSVPTEIWARQGAGCVPLRAIGPDLDHLGLFWCVGFVFVLVMGGLGLGFG